MFKHVNFGKQKLKTSTCSSFQPGMKCLHVFFSFFILGWKFFPVFLTGMNSSRDEISSRQKRVNSKRHFTIDRDDFVQGRVSSRDEISSVNTLLNIKQFLFFLIKNMVYRKKHFIRILFFFCRLWKNYYFVVHTWRHMKSE